MPAGDDICTDIPLCSKRTLLQQCRCGKASITHTGQPGLFDEIQPRKNSEKLMKTLDELNQSGKGKVWFAGRGTAPEWQMKREMLSPSYTTQWTEIPIASF